MVYYTGKDVKVWVMTEYIDRGIELADEGTVSKLSVAAPTDPSSPQTSNGANLVYWYNDYMGYAGFNLSDVTGVDFSFGAADE